MKYKPGLKGEILTRANERVCPAVVTRVGDGVIAVAHCDENHQPLDRLIPNVRVLFVPNDAGRCPSLAGLTGVEGVHVFVPEFRK